MSAIIAPRPSGMDNIPDEDYDFTTSLALLIEEMNEATDETKDAIYDYYSMAYWVIEYVKQQIT